MLRGRSEIRLSLGHLASGIGRENDTSGIGHGILGIVDGTTSMTNLTERAPAGQRVFVCRFPLFYHLHARDYF